MVLIALVLDVAFLIVAFGARTVVQLRRHGDTGWRLGRPRSVVEGLARGLMFAAGALLAAGLVWSGEALAAPLVAIAVGVAVAAMALVAVAQLQMGESWRIGVDHDEHTTLVHTGVYARVRNPIYTGMAVFAVAHAVLTPSVWSVLGAVAMTVGVQLQVRRVEEPYLARLHGEAYRSWTAVSGRFVPGLG